TRAVDTIVLDKTGTVTTGRMSLVNEVDADVLRLVAAVERASEHPIAQAIVAAAPAPLPEVHEFRSHAGLGAEGIVEDGWVVVGRPSLIGGLPPELEAERALIEARGQTAVAASVDGRAVAVLAVADTVKPSSREAVASLKALGLRPILLTGDN